MTRPLGALTVRLVSRGWRPQVGGMERQFDLLAARALAFGADVVAWTAAPKPKGAAAIRIHRSPLGTRSMALYGLWLLVSLALDCVRRRRRGAVTLVAGSSVEAAAVLVLSRRLRGRAVVYFAGGDERGSEFASMQRGWLRRLILARADGLVVHTPSYGAELRSAGFRGDIEVVPVLAVASTERCHAAPMGRASGARARAVWCGRDHPVKNLTALSRMVHGAFLDAGIEVQLVVDRVPALDFGTSEIHVGCPDPPTHFRSAGVVVLTSRHESLPNVLAEAALEGVPLVAYATGGIPEAVAQLGHGHLVDPRATDGEFAAAVLAAARRYADPGQRARLQAAARAVYGVDAERGWMRVLTGAGVRTNHG